MIVFTLCCYTITAQENAIKIKAKLNSESDLIQILQTTTFHNHSSVNLNTIYLHNWANSFKNHNTPLAKRFIEDYKKNFYFSKEKDRGYGKIKNLTVNFQNVSFSELKNQQDIVKITLNAPLKPKDSIVIRSTYDVKIPNAKYTGYGKTNTGYHLRFWHLTPAIYDEEWQLMSNLNLDDLYQSLSKYNISIDVPKKYYIESNLYQYKTDNGDYNNYYLVGTQKKDIIVHISTEKTFKSFKIKDKEIKTDAYPRKVSNQEITKIIDRQIQFIEDFIGKHPHPEILVDSRTVRKNSLHEIYGIPSWLKPFPKNFRWETGFFYALTQKYFDDVIIQNPRKDYWLSDGLQTFLMIEYVKKYYPNITILGKYSNYWPIKTYNISQLKQNDKYALVYQFSSRKFFDQPLTTSSDSLSNFNRKVVSKYKAGLGIKYLADFLGNDIVINAVKEFYAQNQLKPSNSKDFAKILQSKTSKNLQWFFGDYLTTNKKIDHTIQKVSYTKNKDSLQVTIKNRRNFTAPAALYGIQKKTVKFKTWVTNIDSTKTIKIKRGDFNKLALNYENNYPEFNSLDNFRNVNNSIISKPLQFRFFKDFENPYYNQLFYYPDIKYNLYDGLILGVNINNRSIVNHNFDFSITPNYSLKSKNLTGSFSVGYNQFLKESKLYKIRYGISGSNYHYAPELGYNTLSPYISFQLRRKTLRHIGSKFLIARMVSVHKEIAQNQIKSDRDNYNIFNLRYINNTFDAVRRIRYAANLEINSNFSKISTDIRYRKFFTTNESFQIRFFGGLFLSNETEGDYFSFGLNRGSDYLFEQNLFGRSENEGIFSQQFVIGQGGFKSKFSQPHFANQLITSLNTSVSVWKWAEIYNDVAMLKNKSTAPKFFYENGIRLNFLPEIFEFYFPVYTNEGFEVSKKAYASKIRFIISTDIDRIYNFIRRGIL
ncbi:aminopeptidase [Tenacibaculum tangerinum]|uniref:Aminopeptidase n=1 Tax=Tenacibaculum tangerinum TaxID=3038772 RepID=A0ABY8L937_9FLAO|nr:aminopeptidase [Tenacibaculum tangerinum]WGH76878.1 aminopeptidase [Tenacibaculum tangerinum]